MQRRVTGLSVSLVKGILPDLAFTATPFRGDRPWDGSQRTGVVCDTGTLVAILTFQLSHPTIRFRLGEFSLGSPPSGEESGGVVWGENRRHAS